MPYLMLLNSQNIPGEEWELGNDPLVVGRGDVAGVQVADPKMSREHFRICLVGDHYVVEDMNSSGGTLLNEAPVTTSLLKPGDLIQAGDSRFFFDVGMDTMINVKAEELDDGNQSMVGAFIKELRND